MKSAALAMGDTIALLIVTLIGFASHGEFSLAFVPRMAASFIPLCIGWFLLAPLLNLFQAPAMQNPLELWRPGFAMLFIGPFAALLRSILIGSDVVPSFAIVLTLTSAFAITVWRAIAVWRSRIRTIQGG